MTLDEYCPLFMVWIKFGPGLMFPTSKPNDWLQYIGHKEWPRASHLVTVKCHFKHSYLTDKGPVFKFIFKFVCLSLPHLPHTALQPVISAPYTSCPEWNFKLLKITKNGGNKSNKVFSLGSYWNYVKVTKLSYY